MDPKILASVQLKWNENGEISHILQSFVPVNDYKKADAVALSGALLFSGQLGVISPIYAVELCRQLLGFLNFQPHKPEVIGLPLSTARIELIQKDESIVSTFYPDFVARGTMEPEEAVCKLLINYMYYIEKVVLPEIVMYLRSITLMTMTYYLSVALPSELENPTFKPSEVSPRLNFSMIEFTHSIYPLWQTGPTLPADRYNLKMSEAQGHLKSVADRIKRPPKS